MIIGITGVFGSGKTTVACLFAKYGYKHINTDEIGHELLDQKKIKKMVLKEFGNSILTKDKIDRNKLKKIVFYDPNRLKRLNRIVHPFIIKEIKDRVSNHKQDDIKDIIIDGALLIEANALKSFDLLITVKISRKEQLKRILAKKKYTKDEIYHIIRSQLPQKEKLKYADIIIDNSKSLECTIKQVKEVIKELK